MNEIRLDASDAWLTEVRELVETLRRPDASTAFLSKLDRRIGGERTLQETCNYLYNALYGAVRYADAVMREAYGDRIPTVENPRARPKTLRRDVIRNGDGRIVAIEEVAG